MAEKQTLRELSSIVGIEGILEIARLTGARETDIVVSYSTREIVTGTYTASGKLVSRTTYKYIK
ncbi:MAG TPA: hypothetical protein HA360_04540 [Nanoarchaeota archaeon]|nr:hypothetical protein [Candidatus Woesearchaeota archaeon]HIH15142.1 hypothetical protein [Nanoarchaeota archaeon]HIH59409.1 hypothetical protein [Nanoarchaeota archaeon]HII14313.1 hypothetical protein [Nanoarchaeota archaeon]HIJ04600.1 hypothetical protein [Nanoarchaeota archaeon]